MKWWSMLHPTVKLLRKCSTQGGAWSMAKRDDQGRAVRDDDPFVCGAYLSSVVVVVDDYCKADIAPCIVFVLFVH